MKMLGDSYTKDTFRRTLILSSGPGVKYVWFMEAEVRNRPIRLINPVHSPNVKLGIWIYQFLLELI